MTTPFAAIFERRSVGTVRDFVEFLRSGIPNTVGSPVTESSALRISTVTTCVSLVSRTLASLPLGVYERVAPNERKPVADHWLDRVLSQPNPWQTRLNFVQTMQVYLMLHRNAYAWINWVRTGREEIAYQLIPLHPSSIEIEQKNELEPPVYFWRRRNGQRMPLPAREMLHIRGLSTDGVEGRSSLVDGRDVIGRAQVQDEHAGRWWKFGGQPNVILSHPKNLSEKARKDLEEGWESTYGAGADQRRVAVVEEGLTATFPSITNEASQFLETRQMSRAEIAAWFHVPGYMAGLEEKATSWGSGIEQQMIGFLTFTIQPDAVLWEESIAKQLLGGSQKYFVKFNSRAFLRADAKTQAEYLRTMRESCGFSLNDVLALLDMNPVSAAEGGDLRFRPANWVTLNATDSQGVTQ